MKASAARFVVTDVTFKKRNCHLSMHNSLVLFDLIWDSGNEHDFNNHWTRRTYPGLWTESEDPHVKTLSRIVLR